MRVNFVVLPPQREQTPPGARRNIAVGPLTALPRTSCENHQVVNEHGGSDCCFIVLPSLAHASEHPESSFQDRDRPFDPGTESLAELERLGRLPLRLLVGSLAYLCDRNDFDVGLELVDLRFVLVESFVR